VKIFKRIKIVALALLFSIGMSGVFVSAATIVNLGTTTSFAILSGAGITNTGPTTVTGDIGSFPTTTETGFGSITLNGVNHAGDGVTQNAKTDLVTAYNNAAGQGPTIPIVADLGNQILTPGVYNSASSIGLTGTVVLNGGGDPDAVFMFQAGSTLTTASSSIVQLTNGTQACNVYWQIGSSATLGTNSTFKGNLFALISITLTTGATVDGRVLARNGAVTLDSNTIIRPTCTTPKVIKVTKVPGLPNTGIAPQDENINLQWMMLIIPTAVLVSISTYYVIRRLHK